MYGELFFISSENYTKHIKSVCGQNVEFCNVKRSNITRWFKYKYGRMTGTCAACLHTNQSWSYLNHLVQSSYIVALDYNIKPVVGPVILALVLRTVLWSKSVRCNL
jgi:hypothetical protein